MGPSQIVLGVDSSKMIGECEMKGGDVLRPQKRTKLSPSGEEGTKTNGMRKTIDSRKGKVEPNAKVNGRIQFKVKDPGKSLSGGSVRCAYERLSLSLQSPFPNEHEVALKTILALSKAGEGADQEINLIGENPAILRMLLGHTGFYEDEGLKQVLEEVWKGFGCDFGVFWRDLCGEYGVEDLTSDRNELEMGILEGMGEERRVVNDKVEGRVELIGTILRNMSFQKDAEEMARSKTLLKFLLVMAEVEKGTFSQMAYDTISNIAKYCGGGDEEYQVLVKRIINLMIKAVTESSDRFKILRGMESIKGFAEGGLFKDFLNKDLCERILQLVTLTEDILLVVNCLECLLALAEVGGAEMIAEVHGSVSTLVAYVTAANLEKIHFSRQRKFGIDEFEHAITKSMRLTASLILRKLAEESGQVRRSLGKYEDILADIATKGYGCSVIVAQTLHYLDSTQDVPDKVF